MKTNNLFFKTCIILSAAFFTTSCRETTPDQEIVRADETAKTRTMPEIAYPGETGLTKKGMLLGQEITYTEIDGKAVFEGDMILTAEQLGNSANARTQAIAERIYLWPDNTIPYSIDASVTDKSAVLAAIAEVEATTSVKFIQPRVNPLPNYPVLEKDKVTFTRSRGYSSSVGKAGGEQFIGVPIGATKGAILHEIGHTIGLLHEHTRSDRDNFVKVNMDNVSDTDKPNLTKAYSDDYNPLSIGNFDFGSLMMMDSWAYSKNSLPVMTAKDGKTFSVQREHFSETDIRCITTIYANVFASTGNKIFVGDAVTGKTADFKTYWPDARKLFATTNYLFLARGADLWKMDAKSGTGISLQYPFNNTQGITYLDGYAYAVQNGYLYKINLISGTKFVMGGQYWVPATGITYAFGFFFIINGDILFRVSPQGTSYVSMGAGYKGATEIVTMKEKVYILKTDGKLYKIDPMSGAPTLHTDVTFKQGAQLASTGKNLLVVSGSTLFNVTESGVVTTVSNNWEGVTELAAIDPATK